MARISAIFVFVLSVINGFMAEAKRHAWSAKFAPSLRENIWWGAEKPAVSLNQTLPFKVEVSSTMLTDLNDRLERFLQAETNKPFYGQGFTMGFNADYLREIVTYWKDSYNWTKRVDILNSVPQSVVNGLHLHYLHVKPASANITSFPLLLLHGWPGSVREFYDLIPLLVTPKTGFAFEVIAPSLPGYGFSEGAARPGLGPAEIAVVLRNLMKMLGHKKFFIQGGDWGSVIAKRIAVLFPQSVLGIHLNMCVTMSPQARFMSLLSYIHPRLLFSEKFDSKYHPLTFSVFELFKESAYFIHQSTKPDTLGIVLSDTPAGLAAYILEKFSTWTDNQYRNLYDGGLTRKFSLDALLDNVMIYWITGTITSSMRLYYENLQPAEQELSLENAQVYVPVACARFDREMWQPKKILQTVFKRLVHVSDLGEGGHFAAFELPTVLADDMFIAFKKMVP